MEKLLTLQSQAFDSFCYNLRILTQIKNFILKSKLRSTAIRKERDSTVEFHSRITSRCGINRWNDITDIMVSVILAAIENQSNRMTTVKNILKIENLNWRNLLLKLIFLYILTKTEILLYKRGVKYNHYWIGEDNFCLFKITWS